MDVGTWGEWAGAFASIGAAAVSVAALVVAQKANAYSRDSNALAQKANEAGHNALAETRAIRAHDLQQAEDARRAGVASQLQAWWVAADGQWVIQVVNGAAGASVFRDIKIFARGKKPLSIEVLPPGAYVVFQNPAGADYPWGFPRFATDNEQWNPITKSREHVVERMTFRDPVGTAWSWSRETGLTENS